LTAEIPTDAAPLLERCFLFDAVEASYPIGGVAGSIPPWLRGTYYVNGPARFERAGRRVNHWLDGDGMVCSLRFSGDGVSFTSRFVQTLKLRDEEAAGRFLYRGFGTSFPGDRLRRGVMLEPPVNISVYPWAGRLLAFGEQSLPVELDPMTLDTRGEYDFGGSLNEVTPFAAHAKVDPVTGNLLNFGISFSAAAPALNVYEFDAALELARRRRHPLTHPHALHDFGFTAHSTVFYLSPLHMDFGRFLNGNLSVVESLVWAPEKGSRILVAPRQSKNTAAFTVDVESRHCLHFINCFEEGDTITVDVLEMDRPIYSEYQPIPDILANPPPCRPVRYEIDLQTRSIRNRCAMAYELFADFPAMDAHRAGVSYDDFWMLAIGACGRPGRKFLDRVVRGDWNSAAVCDEWVAAPGRYLGGEPVYVANPRNPHEGVVIVEHLLPAEERAEFLLFDGHALQQGPVAALPLSHPIHPGFHTSFQFE
jgi:carotenoid cleavage dioxygenase-like enzyme